MHFPHSLHSSSASVKYIPGTTSSTLVKQPDVQNIEHCSQPEARTTGKASFCFSQKLLLGNRADDFCRAHGNSFITREFELQHGITFRPGVKLDLI